MVDMDTYWSTSTTTHDRLKLEETLDSNNYKEPPLEEFLAPFDTSRSQRKVRGISSLLTALFIAALPVLGSPSINYAKDSTNTPQKEILYKESTINGNTHSFSTPDPQPSQLKDNPLDNSVVVGYIKEQPTGIWLPNGKVVAIDSLTHQRIDSTYSDNSGYFTFEVITGQQNLKKLNLEDKIYPNPYTSQANIEINTTDAGYYHTTVVGADGKTLFEKDIKLENRYNSLSLTGGIPGQYIVNSTKGNDVHQFKAIQAESTGAPLDIRVSDKGKTESSLKSTSITDYLIFEYSKAGHITSRQVAQIAPNIDLGIQDLWLVPNYTINVILRPFDVLGNHANVSLTIAWPDSTINYTQSSDNKIHINKNLYTSTAVGIISLDTITNGKYTPWAIFQSLNKATSDTNRFQSPKENGSATYNNPPQPGPANFADTAINNHELNAFFLQKKVPDPLGAPGDSILTYDVHIREMMSTRNGGVKTLKYIDVPGVTPFYKLQLAYDPFNNIPIPTAQTDRQKTLSDMTDNMSPIPNAGVKIFVDATFHFAQNSSDPILQQCITRDDQYTEMYFYSSTGYPGNSVTTKFTPDGKVRASTGEIADNQNDTDGIVFAEYYKGKTTVTDPMGNTAGPYVWSSTLNGPTVLAYFMADALGILNLNTKYY